MSVEAYHEVCAWSLTLGDAEFLHQYVVDAWKAQTAESGDKPIGIAFALVGLCLHVEYGFTGREAQKAHMKMAEGGGRWPTFALPTSRGRITSADVLAAPAGPERIAAVEAWTRAVWDAYRPVRPAVEALLREHRIIP